MEDQVMVATPTTGDQVNTGGATSDEMVQYVIYSGEGDQPIGLEELRDALTKLTGQPVTFQEGQDTQEVGEKEAQPALGQDTDLGFRLSAERMVGEVSFVDDSIIENKSFHDKPSKAAPKSSLTSSKAENPQQTVSEILKRQQAPQIPSQITIETEYGPITLDTSKLTQGQLDGTEQITVNLLTTDPNGDASKEVTETRGLKLPPGLLAPKGKNVGLGITDMADDASIQGSDFNSVLQQLTDLCSEQNPLPVQDTEKALLKDAEGLEDFMNLKLPAEQTQKQSNVIEMDRLESFLKSKFGDSAKIQIQPGGGVVVQQPKIQSIQPVKPVICCAAHSELKNQETRRRMLPIPLDVTKCPECHKECVNRKNLRLHIQRFHVPDFKHQCQTRARVIPPPPEDIITDIPVLVESTENLAAIGEKSAPKAYKCSVCEMQLETQKEYFTHLERHGQRPLHCTQCGMHYTKVHQLKNHVDVVHGGVRNLQCKHCMQVFSSTMGWKAHEQQHETPNEGVLMCLKCGNLIPQAKFRHHMASLHRIVHKPKLDCVFCGSRFRTPEYLAAHTQQYHNFEKNAHLCALCYKAFPSADERDGHILRSHKDEEIMDADIEFSWQPRDCYKRQCARCGIEFPNYAKLKAHYDRHGNEKNACLLCGEEFHWIVNLDLHYKREHSTADIVKFGVKTPTMSLIRVENGSFELTPKVGRQYASRFDLADQEPMDEVSGAGEMVVMEYTSVERAQRPPPPMPPRVVTAMPRKVQKTVEVKRSKIVVPKQSKTPQSVKMATSSPFPVSVTRNVSSKDSDERCEKEFNKAVGNTDFDYKKYLPAIDKDTDLATVKAPRHTDIVINRPATVINLARVWTRRENGLFYMGNEAEKFRRAAATIPKKRMGDKWVEMPLFVDDLSGKLVTVEGMAELWRERAQLFLDLLGRGQVISDFLPSYDAANKVKKVEASVQRSETSIEMVTEKPAGEGEGQSEVTTEKEQEKSPTDKPEEASRKSQEEDDSQWFTKKVLVDGVLRDSDESPRKRGPKRPPEKDILPDIVQGVKKARQMMKARAKGEKTTGWKSVTDKRRYVSIKGKKGRPPGFNPDRDCPYRRRPRLILTNITDIIGDAKKIIVQMEPEHSPERKHWKKQTARKSIAQRKPSASASATASPSGSRASRSKPLEKQETKKDEEETKRANTRAQRDNLGKDEVDGPPAKKQCVVKEPPDEEPSDKGAGDKGAKSNNTKDSKNVQKRGSKTDSGPAAKKSKNASPAKTPSIVSPREAMLSGKAAKIPPERPKTPKSKTETEKAKTTPVKNCEESPDPTPKKRGRPPKKTADEDSPVKPKTPEKKPVKENETEKRPRGRPKKSVESKGLPNEAVKETAAAEQTTEDTHEIPITTPDKLSLASDDVSDSHDPDMPTLDLEISSQEYLVPSDSPLPSTSSTSDDISRETKRAMQFLPDDFDLEEASLETRRRPIKMVLYENDSASVKMVGTACSPTKERQDAEAGDAWDVLVGTPTKTPAKQS